MGLFTRLSAPFSSAAAARHRATLDLFAPLSGELMPIEEVPDLAFAEKLIGDGIALVPTSDQLLAPCDGVVAQIDDLNHCVTLQTANGLELFVHLGTDALTLGRQGFEPLVEEGQAVKRGEALVRLDWADLGAPLHHNPQVRVTPMVVTNMADVRRLEKSTGSVVAGETVVMRVQG